MNFQLPEPVTSEEQAAQKSVWHWIRALNANCLAGVDLIRCWIGWRIMPVSHREGLMCQYDTKDINSLMKKLCGEPKQACSKIGLKPFCRANPAPEVDNFTSHPFDLMPSYVPW